MTPTESRLLTLAYRFASAGKWDTMNRWAVIDAQVHDHAYARSLAAPAEAEAVAILEVADTESVGRAMCEEAHELHHTLLEHHPDLAAGFPPPDYPDKFTPAERAKQVAPILAALVERLRPKDEPQPNPQPLDADDMMRAVMMCGGETAGQILVIANDPNLTTDEKQRRIYALDNTALGWDSVRWGELCGVSGAAARATDWWKTDRQSLRDRD